eukprot:Pgem_evm1s5989
MLVIVIIVDVDVDVDVDADVDVDVDADVDECGYCLCVDDIRFGYLPTVTFIAEIFGSLFWGWFSDQFGR